jgi:hypothetical protein
MSNKVKRFICAVVFFFCGFGLVGCTDNDGSGTNYDDNNVVIQVECLILPDHPSCN